MPTVRNRVRRGEASFNFSPVGPNDTIKGLVESLSSAFQTAATIALKII